MGWLVRAVKLSQLLRSSHRRLREGGLIWLVIGWSAFSLLSFYWPSRVLLAPWLTQLSAITHFDPSLLSLPLAAASQSGMLGILGVIFLAHYLISPALEAMVYGRLLRPGQRKFSLGAFYRLYLLETLLVLLAAWLVYLSQGFWWGLVNKPGLLAGLLVCWGLAAYLAGLALSYYKAGLAARSSQPNWPELKMWAVTAAAQAWLSFSFLLLALGLEFLAWRTGGAWLLLALLLVGGVRTYGRVWKVACAISAWEVK